MEKNSNVISVGSGLVCMVCILLIVGVISNICTPKCKMSGCNNDVNNGEDYCYLHNYSRNYYYNNGGHSNFERTNSTVDSNSSNKTNSNYSNKNNSTKNNKSTYSHNNSEKYSYNNSYDDGYNAIYEDDDYDWDRYMNDDDYADGVDDALEDEDWD